MSDRERQIAELVRIAEDHRYSAEFVGNLLRAKLGALAAVPFGVTDEQEALRQIRDFDAWRAFPGKQDRPETATSQAMRKIARAALEAAGGADERHREAVGKAIYEEALQQIVDADPSARDAMLIAAKALGDASEYQNTGKVRWRPPEAAGVQPTEEDETHTDLGYCEECGEPIEKVEGAYLDVAAPLAPSLTLPRRLTSICRAGHVRARIEDPTQPEHDAS